MEPKEPSLSRFRAAANETSLIAPTHHEQRTELLEQMAERVHIVQQLFNLMEEIKDAPVEVVVANLEAFLKQLKQQFQADELREMEEYFQFKTKLERLKYKSVIPTSAELKEIDELELLLALSGLDHNAQFLPSLEAGVRRLAEHVRQLDQIRKSTVTMADLVSKISHDELGQSIKFDSINRIIDDAFCRIYLINPIVWRRIAKNCSGFSHPSGIIIGSNDEETEETIRHERLHIYGYHFTDHISHSSPLSKFKFMTKDLNKLINSGAIEAIGHRLSDPLLPGFLLDQTQNELLAEFTNAGDQLYKIDGLSFSDENYSALKPVLRTAGKEMVELIDYLETLPQTEPFSHPVLKDVIEKLKTNFKTAAENMIRQLCQAKRLAREMSLKGGEGEAELWSALLILKPSQYRHLESYLESRVKNPNQT